MKDKGWLKKSLTYFPHSNFWHHISMMSLVELNTTWSLTLWIAGVTCWSQILELEHNISSHLNLKLKHLVKQSQSHRRAIRSPNCYQTSSADATGIAILELISIESNLVLIADCISHLGGNEKDLQYQALVVDAAVTCSPCHHWPHKGTGRGGEAK